MSFLEEAPSRDFRDRVFAAAEVELARNRSPQVGWNRRLVLAGGLFAAVVAITSQFLVRESREASVDMLTALNDSEMLEESEVLDDLEFFEDLAEVEDWDGIDS